MPRIQLIGQRSVNKIVSHQPEVRAAVRFHAERLGAKAESLLDPHRKTGNAHIEVEHHDVDSFVWLVDEAARHIEYGHVHNITGEWVEGLYIIHKAAGLV
ncbi:DUF5403 family protein [Amycolatopsis anabasis]|uniref:DUF5403 family protein n=1 Tax=Amycolatopsis anabasis TaxID=1840409 RepID=UPI00131D8AB6|nr:DUF5403 family protein [Amycolatopsis anabasis]